MKNYKAYPKERNCFKTPNKDQKQIHTWQGSWNCQVNVFTTSMINIVRDIICKVNRVQWKQKNGKPKKVSK